MSDADREPVVEARPSPDDTLFDSLVDAWHGAVDVAKASRLLLRSELRLARSSALLIVWLAFAFIILGAGAWLSSIAAIAAGIYQLSGNFFLGVAVVAAINLAGIVWVVLMMRRCWRDLSLPQTRALIFSGKEGEDITHAAVAVGEKDA